MNLKPNIYVESMDHKVQGFAISGVDRRGKHVDIPVTKAEMAELVERYEKLKRDYKI